MAIALVAQPKASDLEQLREIIAQPSLKVFQVNGKTRSKAFRVFEVIEANRMSQTIDPPGEQLNAGFEFARHTGCAAAN